MRHVVAWRLITGKVISTYEIVDLGFRVASSAQFSLNNSLKPGTPQRGG